MLFINYDATVLFNETADQFNIKAAHIGFFNWGG